MLIYPERWPCIAYIEYKGAQMQFYPLEPWGYYLWLKKGLNLRLVLLPFDQKLYFSGG